MSVTKHDELILQLNKCEGMVLTRGSIMWRTGRKEEFDAVRD